MTNPADPNAQTYPISITMADLERACADGIEAFKQVAESRGDAETLTIADALDHMSLLTTPLAEFEAWAVAEGLLRPVRYSGGDYATVTGGDYATVTGGDFATVTGGDWATVTGGDRATVTGGDWATVTGGDWATVTGGDRATVTGGYEATVTGGDFATVTGGDWATVTGGGWATVSGGYKATVTGGGWATVTGGDGATVTGGDWATVSGGDGATVTGGDWAELRLSYRQGRRRTLVGYVGETLDKDGAVLKPGVAYRCALVDDKAEWVRA